MGYGRCCKSCSERFSPRGWSCDSCSCFAEDRAFPGVALQHRVARWYQGLEELLNDAEVDIVYVASPNHCHADDCLASIRAGKSVLCEKPFALNLKQAQEIVYAARQQRVFCMEGMWTRFIPAVVEAKRWIDSGSIGAIHMVQGNFAYPVAAGPGNRLFDLNCGGGALLDRGVYLISLAQQLLGTPQLVRGSACLGSTGVDEQSAYHLVYPTGSLADFVASFHVRGTNEVVIYGELGRLHLCEPFYRAHRVILQSYASPQEVAPEESKPSPTGLSKIARAMRDVSVLKSLRRRLSPLVDLLRKSPAPCSFRLQGMAISLSCWSPAAV